MKTENGKVYPATNRAAKKQLSGTKAEDLATKPDHYLDCYELRHSYERVGSFFWGEGGTCRVTRCIRCGTIRDTYFRADGSLMDSRYYYPDHYLRVGSGRVSTADVMAESNRRHGVYAHLSDIPGINDILADSEEILS